jgi:hypothetical protein
MHRLAALRLGENATNAVFIIANYRRVRQHRPPFAHRVARGKTRQSSSVIELRIQYAGDPARAFFRHENFGYTRIRKRGCVGFTVRGLGSYLVTGKTRKRHIGAIHLSHEQGILPAANFGKT